MKETAMTILYYADILPLIPITYFVLGESVAWGPLLLWVLSIFAGLVLINFAEN